MYKHKVGNTSMARDQIAQALNKQDEKRSTIKLTNSLFVKSRIIFLAFPVHNKICSVTRDSISTLTEKSVYLHPGGGGGRRGGALDNSGTSM